MKNLFWMIGIAALLSSCGGEGNQQVGTEDVKNPNTASAEVGSETMAAIDFGGETVYDFGSITQGEKVTHSFSFTNTGDAELVIVSAKGSCGCTVPQWPKEPVPVGGTAMIDVVFNSDGKKGVQNKKVSIVANTNPSTSVVVLKGEVIAPEVEEAEAGS